MLRANKGNDFTRITFIFPLLNYIHNILEVKVLDKEKEKKEIGGLVFVACMFIGAGICLLFGRADVGGAIGMGIGFLAMAFLRGKEVRRVEVSVPKTLPSIGLTLVGLLLIATGVLLFVSPELLYPYLAGVAAIILGIFLVITALISLKKT